MKKQMKFDKKPARSFSGKPGIRRPRKKVPRNAVPASEDTRLNKFIASSGICSRREADEFIRAGLVTINGKLVTELGSKVKPGDEVRYNGEPIKTEKLVYILLNKPKDYITTLRDPHASRTVLDLITNACKERVYPVGRLDRNTTGVLLLTNDGDLTKVLTHPSYNKAKIYHASLDKSLAHSDLKKIEEGITLDDGFIKADAISYADMQDKKEIGIEIHSGRNKIVRRIFEQLGYKVKKLDRVYFAGLTKKGLTRGKWRFLNEKEISMLKMGAYR
jgi:23S rRNA pseudouridine2605 synthase